MATRTINFTQWLKLLTKTALGDGFEHLGGPTIADAAERLGVSTTRVYQLIEEGALDTIAITSGKRIAISLVTDASLERYLADRTPDRNRQGYFSFATAK